MNFLIAFLFLLTKHVKHIIRGTRPVAETV